MYGANSAAADNNERGYEFTAVERCSSVVQRLSCWKPQKINCHHTHEIAYAYNYSDAADLAILFNRIAKCGKSIEDAQEFLTVV